MPSFENFATGMLFVPAPARAIAFTLAGRSILCMSAERTKHRIGMTDLGGDFVSIARQALETADGDVVEREDFEGHVALRDS